MPVMFFKNIKSHRINSLNQKITYLKKMKLDFITIIKFNRSFSLLTPDQFIENIIYKKLRPKYIFVSNNFKFGKNREGNIKTLKKNEKFFGFKILITSPLKKTRKVISSTIIRKKITLGKIKEANRLLNRPWSVIGKVIQGMKRGRKIGFPTCNVKLGNYIIPKLGVYSVIVETNQYKKKGIANIGYRPTFNGQNLLLEVNIFGFNKNLYNKVIKVYFKNFIRPERKFKNLDKLKKQIKIDIDRA